MMKLKGIVLVTESPQQYSYHLDDNAAIDEIADFLRLLPESHELTFYDQFYPSVSDPGAYVSVQRKGDVFAYRLQNHGWSSEWLHQSAELIAAYMKINNKDSNDKKTPLVITIKKGTRKAFS